MKKLIANHKLTQKIFLSIIVVLLLSFTVPVKSQAGLGGILLDPLFDLVGTILDVVTGALQAFLVDGEFNNSEDSSGLNFYLADKDDFMSKVDNEYKEFKYHTGSGEAEVEISADDLDKSFFGNSTYAIPVMKYSPEKIFSGLIPALDINFVNPTDWNARVVEDKFETQTGVETNIVGSANENGEAMNERSIARALHSTIASWYVSLRNLAVVALMLVLVYVGIRIVISSTASDKAKYKQMLIDWLVALCILFCLHYIMTFTTTIVNEVTKAISGSASSNGNNVAVTVTGDTTSDGKPVQFNTDLMGLIRFRMQAPTVGGKILYLILYLAMVIYTCMFTFYYLKRVLTIAFLTLIAPLVAMTYPIDKIRDGKAQAFDMWLKEFIFNSLLQPFHLIIYSIFVGSAVDLAVKNPLFAIVALAFITPAEKILRKFFGFEKASTAGALGAVASAAGGAAFMNQMQKLMAPKKGGGGAGGNKGIRNKNNPEGSAPGIEDAFGSGNGSNNNEEPQDSPQQRMLDAYDEGFGTDSYDPAEREAMAREVSQPEGMHYSDDELRQIYRDTGYSEDEIAAMLSGSGESGVANGRDNTAPQGAPEEPAPTPRLIGSHLRGPWQWSDDDERGAGEYLSGIARSGASWAGRKIANTEAGQGAIRFGRTVAGSARSVRDFATNKIARPVGDFVNNTIPKPLRNSAKTLARATGHAALGVGNVAVQSGLAVGKAAIKAVPGAAIGMAAGIAGDELSDIPKYTLAGAALSSTIGSSAVAQAGSFISNAYRQGSGTSYEVAIKDRQKAYVENNEELYRQKFPDASKKELKAKLEQGAYYDSVGIEGKDTLKAVKMESKIKREMMEQQGMAEKEASQRAQAQTAAIMKEVKDYSAKDLRDEDVVKGLRTDLSKRLETQGLRGHEKMQTIDMIVKQMKSVRGVDNDY